jgi:PAS domain S-box-containing protein
VSPSLAPDHLALVADTLERSEEIVAVLRRDGADRLLVAGLNGAFSRMLALAPEQAAGAAFPDVLGGPMNEVARCAIADAARNRASLRTTLACRRRDGEALSLGIHLMPAAGDRYLLVGRDITQQEQDRKRQDSANALLARVFMQLDAAVAVLDADGRVLMANRALERLLGQPSGGLAARLAPDFAAADQRDTIAAALARQARDRRPFSTTSTLVRADGHSFRARVTSEGIEHPDLKFPRVVTFVALIDPAPAERTNINVAGKIRRIALDPIRQALGDRWDTVAARALATAEHVVGKHIGRRDSFSRADDGAFLVCFDGVSEDEATLRAAMIEREVRQRLLGVEETRAITQGGVIAAQLPETRMNKARANRLIAEHLDAQRGEIEERARRMLRTALADANCRLDEARQRGGAVLAHDAVVDDATEQRFVAAYAALTSEESADFDLDLLRLRLATTAAADPDLSGPKLPVLVDVSYDLLKSRRRTDQYVAYCRTLSEPLRERLVLMLADLPRGLSEVRVLDRVQHLRPFCREIGFAPREVEALPFSDSRASKITVAIAYHAIAPVAGAAEEPLAGFIQSVRARAGRLLVRDVPSDAAARTLWESGVDLITLRRKAR